MRFIHLLLVLSTLVAANAHAWELSDVSVLFPMPKSDRETLKLLTVNDGGAKGALVPAAVTGQLPQLVYNSKNADTFKTYLRAVGLRFDPCFNENLEQVICRRQIRIVWQPIKLSKGVLVTLDAPVHTFYEFDQASWHQLINDYAALIKANPLAKEVTTLNVNPRVKAQGFDGNFYVGLKKLILQNCGAANLVRVTMMSIHPGDNEWNFLGFNIENGKMLPISIARINKPVQVVKTATPKNFDLTATVSPIGFSKTSAALYQNSVTAKPKISDTDMQAFAADILHIENPRASNTANVDCASCHLTGPAAQWLKLNYPKWNWQEMSTLGGWSSRRDLTNTTIDFLKPRRMRSFGYFYADALIAQRTINESAVVADELDQSHPNK